MIRLICKNLKFCVTVGKIEDRGNSYSYLKGGYQQNEARLQCMTSGQEARAQTQTQEISSAYEKKKKSLWEVTER